MRTKDFVLALPEPPALKPVMIQQYDRSFPKKRKKLDDYFRHCKYHESDSRIWDMTVDAYVKA